MLPLPILFLRVKGDIKMNIAKDTMFNVKNRSTSTVVYRIPEMNIRREWQPGESKRISYEEIEN